MRERAEDAQSEWREQRETDGHMRTEEEKRKINSLLIMAGTSSPPTDPLFHSDPPFSAPNPAGSPRLPAARLSGAFRVPVSVNGTSGGGAPPPPPPSPPPPPHTECKMVEVHGVKVASFTVNGAELICLPQVFELFLKHLVGGLHTVYTKLKRLDISPVVCTVEQVRVLRGLGAIQPGVNRCKLITRADFETLYRDCTNASSRPGRPPKRTLGVATMTDGSRLLPHGLLSPTLLSQTGLTAAAMAEALKLQKMRMMIGFHGNSDQQRHHNGAESENDDTGTTEIRHHHMTSSDRYPPHLVSSPVGGSEGSWEKEQRLLSPPSSVVVPPAGSASLHLNSLQQHSSLLANRLSDIPFMVMPHPLLPVGLPPASVAMAMNQMSQLSSLANMATVSQVQTEKGKESPLGSPSPYPSPSDDDELHPPEPTSQSPSRASSSSSSPPPPAHTPELGEVVAENIKKVLKGKDDGLLPLPLLKPTYEKLPLASQPLSINHTNPAFTPFLLAEGLSSMETLLTNIQGLLKVAVESARSQDKQNQLERKELKLELERERDARQVLQRQLSSELQTRVSIQRRLKKEKKAKRKLQEALDFESRRREQVERALKHDSLTDAVTPESELENKQQENSAAHENRAFTKPPLLF
ncbi:dachshund homolog 2 isoform X2 [Lates calcarifer]|uniref:Dachshund homolog 2 isoform X2 n=1 Tax=Lates calcarifer TaxID=8187 RepID=A0AAJ8B2M4_LATCA|nr:dachshund homolog 2 isoform X2 [Lates calcarifer]